MTRPNIYRRWYTLLPAAGLLFSSGCLAALERNLDVLLAPDALSNAIVAPYSAAAGLLHLAMRLLPG